MSFTSENKFSKIFVDVNAIFKGKYRTKKSEITSISIKKSINAYINASQSSATKRAYASDLRYFFSHGGCVLCMPKKLAKYLTESAKAGLAMETLERRITVIHQAHVDKHYLSSAQSEIVRQVLQRMHRTFGTKQRQVKPLLKNDLLAVLEFIKANCMLDPSCT